MNKFNWDLINQSNTVVHCESEKQAIELLTEAHNNGFKWSSDEPYIYSNYINTKYNYIQNCYDINNGQISSIKWYNTKNYEILKFEECKLMNKLLDVDFIIQKDNKTIVLDIKHMDESLRKGNFSILAQSEGGKYSIWSNCYPVIDSGKLLLRGSNREKDNEFAYHTFNSTEEMHEYITNINKLIDEINNPIIEINVNKNKYYKINGYKIEINYNYNAITIRKDYVIIKSFYIDDNEIEGQPFSEVSEEFDNFCKRRGIKAKLIKG